MGLPRRAVWAMSGRPAKPIRFAYFTDVHARTEWDTPVAMARMVAALNAQRPDFVIAGGDLITDGFQSSSEAVAPRWKVLMDMVQTIEAPFFPAIGNHDYVAARPVGGAVPSTNPRGEFLERFGLERTYRVERVSGVPFFFLDPIEVLGGEVNYRGWVDETQQAWIKSELASVPAEQPVVLVTHIPLLTAFPQATAGATAPVPIHRVVANNREVLRLFQDHNLVLVLQGHVHVDELLRWNKTTFITGGAVCARWWRGPRSGTEEGFGMVTMSENRVEWEYIDYGWEARRPAGR